MADQTERLFEIAKAAHLAGNREGAALAYTALIKARPDHADALSNMACLMRDGGKPEVAMTLFRRALDLRLDDSDILFNAARCALWMELHDEAERYLDAGYKLAPEDGKFSHTIGLHRMATGRYRWAVSYFNKALELAPGQPEILWDRSLAYLTMGEYQKGWEFHDSRFDWLHQWVRQIPIPLWHGQDLTGKTLWIYSDQGAGDNIMALRFLRDFSDRANTPAKLILDVPGNMMSLFHYATGICVNELRARGSDIPVADYHLPLMSLPGRLGTSPESISGAPYVRIGAQVERAQVPAAEPLKVGLVWRGFSGNTRDNVRSIPLATLLPLLEIPGISFFAFQEGASAGDITANSMNMLMTDLSPVLADWLQTARYVDKMDLMITVDTAVGHLSGAMGKPCWMMIPYNPDWRWSREGDRTAWYDSVRLFRQKRPKSWDSVVDDVRAQLVVWRNSLTS